jgi:hypothetical protein
MILDHLRTACTRLAARVGRPTSDAADVDRPRKLRLPWVGNVVLTHLTSSPAGDVEEPVIHREVDVGHQRRHRAKEVPYTFRDLEPEMGTPTHLALHPFDRVPIMQHGDFMLYETSAIAAYVDEVFDGPKLTPADPQKRARVNQWISAVNAYYYPYLIYHVSHERNVFPQLRAP